MLSEKRILRLAAKYGPFVRFYPEGTEEKDALDGAIKDGEKAELEGNKEWDKTRQRADQEAANAKKAREELSETQTELETAQSETESLKAKLAEAETKAAQAGITEIKLDESEYQGTDLNLVRAIKSLKQELLASNKETKALKDKAAGYEDRDRKEQAKLAQNSNYEELLSDLDDEYGADCRNEALKKFNEMCKSGEVPKGNPTKATRAMEKCYKEVKAKSKETKKSSLSLDTGSGGGNTPNLTGSNIKEGSLDDVDAQISKTAFGAKTS